MQYYHAHILVIYKLYQYSVHMQILQDDPSWEHGVKDNGATAIEHSAVLPKQACSNTAVDLEEQHPRHHIKVQTSLLEADGEKDTAAITQVCFRMPPLCSNSVLFKCIIIV